ncbi:hypothetical protein P3T27_006177 [Kitasatospora sp. MAA19]|uniref:hypothetical protein n=1 Tax=Kitasatospora sp. MAA19 TaxID=3035090 RepID=UPI002476681D|nr:hypothetical protein [Kitasatospora sp. MAA19]MDH6709431.1 hypothetical protein [Kitasatospora sp. MAA19]
MTLFTGPVDDPLAFNNNPPMQDALDTTRQQLSDAGTPTVDDLAVIVVALTGFEGGLNHPWAAIRDQDECYSASLLKIAAMYTAFDLRASADQLATDQGLTTWSAVQAALTATFDPDITAHTPALISQSTVLRSEDKARKPNYSAVLRLGDGSSPFAVDFTPAQTNAFEDMMVQQHDPGATTTIHGLGYPYLDGKIADDGLFDSTSSQGLWLAGDYAGVWPAARIPCVNDGDTAQGTTARQLVRLLTLLADDKLVGPTSSEDMKALMARAGKFFASTVPPIWPPGGQFVATHGKVGIGSLQTLQTVLSEGILVSDTVRGRSFAVAYQNVIQDGLTQRQALVPVATLIEAALNAF